MDAGGRLIDRNGDDHSLVKAVHGRDISLLAIAGGHGEQRETAQAGMLEQVRALRQRRRTPEKQHEAGCGGRDGGAMVGNREAGGVGLRERRQIVYRGEVHKDRLRAAFYGDLKGRADRVSKLTAAQAVERGGVGFPVAGSENMAGDYTRLVIAADWAF